MKTSLILLFIIFHYLSFSQEKTAIYGATEDEFPDEIIAEEDETYYTGSLYKNYLRVSKLNKHFGEVLTQIIELNELQALSSSTSSGFGQLTTTVNTKTIKSAWMVKDTLKVIISEFNTTTRKLNYFSVSIDKNDFTLYGRPQLLFTTKAISLKSPYNRFSPNQATGGGVLVVLNDKNLEFHFISEGGSLNKSVLRSTYTSSSLRIEDTYHFGRNNLYLFGKIIEKGSVFSGPKVHYSVLELKDDEIKENPITFENEKINEIYSIPFNDTALIITGYNLETHSISYETIVFSLNTFKSKKGKSINYSNDGLSYKFSNIRVTTDGFYMITESQKSFSSLNPNYFSSSFNAYGNYHKSVYINYFPIDNLEAPVEHEIKRNTFVMYNLSDLGFIATYSSKDKFYILLNESDGKPKETTEYDHTIPAKKNNEYKLDGNQIKIVEIEGKTIKEYHITNSDDVYVCEYIIKLRRAQLPIFYFRFENNYGFFTIAGL